MTHIETRTVDVGEIAERVNRERLAEIRARLGQPAGFVPQQWFASPDLIAHARDDIEFLLAHLDAALADVVLLARVMDARTRPHWSLRHDIDQPTVTREDELRASLILCRVLNAAKPPTETDR